MNNTISQHISKQFDEELERVRSQVLEMGGLIEQQLSEALKSLNSHDVDIATEVVSKEAKINSYEINIDQECVNILAIRQPAASDLRLVIAITKTANDLERIGDEAEKIAKISRLLAEKNGFKSYYTGINTMGSLVTSMLHNGLDTFARMDSQRALEVATKEPETDEQYKAILRQLMTYMMEDSKNISATLEVIWIARALERIADHTRNICEHVIYFAEGKDVRHASLKQMEEIVKD